jgi:chromosome partitioning protein
MIIVIGGVKGGSGKTTLATNFAVLRSNDKKKVLLVDADEQKSSSQWANQREVLGIPTKWSTIQLFGKTLHTQIQRMKDDYDDIIIDVGGRDTTSQRSALAIADIYLIPFKPRSFDVWTIGDVKTIIMEMKIANPKLKSYCVINQADSKGVDNDASIEILNECEEIKCLNLTIGCRKAFANASSEGLGIIEMKTHDKKAIKELVSLYKTIYIKRP